MILHTAQMRYGGSDRLDITIKSKDPLGVVFAPTWNMVMGFKQGRIDWDTYKDQYLNLMRTSYRDHRDQWISVLSKPEVTFVCFCKANSQCHRYLLADYFTRLGADYRGERGDEKDYRRPAERN